MCVYLLGKFVKEQFGQVSNFGIRILQTHCHGADLTSDLHHVVEN